MGIDSKAFEIKDYSAFTKALKKQGYSFISGENIIPPKSKIPDDYPCSYGTTVKTSGCLLPCGFITSPRRLIVVNADKPQVAVFSNKMLEILVESNYL